MFERESPYFEVLRQIELFQHLSAEQLRILCPRLVARQYRKGTIIFSQGDEGSSLYILRKGRVRIFMTGSVGREATLRIYKPCSIFGEIAVLDGGPRAAGAQALDEVSVLLLQRDVFLSLLRDNFAMVQQVFALLTERMRYTTYYSELLAFLSGPGRVAAVLVQLAATESLSPGPVQLSLTQQELADFSRTTREWVNRILNDFADAGLVALERGSIIVLDLTRLKQKVHV